MVELEESAAILGCRVLYIPLECLRFPLGSPFKSRAMWNGVMERLQAGRNFIYQKWKAYIN